MHQARKVRLAQQHKMRWPAKPLWFFLPLSMINVINEFDSPEVIAIQEPENLEAPALAVSVASG
jgi:hypothetical protein